MSQLHWRQVPGEGIVESASESAALYSIHWLNQESVVFIGSIKRVYFSLAQSKERSIHLLNQESVLFIGSIKRA